MLKHKIVLRIVPIKAALGVNPWFLMMRCSTHPWFASLSVNSSLTLLHNDHTRWLCVAKTSTIHSAFLPHYDASFSQSDTQDSRLQFISASGLVIKGLIIIFKNILWTFLLQTLPLWWISTQAPELNAGTLHDKSRFSVVQSWP